MTCPTCTTSPTLTGVSTTEPDTSGVTSEASSATKLPVALLTVATSRSVAGAVSIDTMLGRVDDARGGRASAAAPPRQPAPAAAHANNASIPIRADVRIGLIVTFAAEGGFGRRHAAP